MLVCKFRQAVQCCTDGALPDSPPIGSRQFNKHCGQALGQRFVALGFDARLMCALKGT